MKYFVLPLFLFAVIWVAHAVPTGSESSISIRQRREIDVFSNSRKLIEELATNLRKAAIQARDAVSTFTAGVQEQLNLSKDKLLKDIEKLRTRVGQAIQSITDRFNNSSTAVRECVNSHKSEADSLFNETFTKTVECADNRVKEIGELVNGLTTLSNNAIEFANNAIVEMRNCTSQQNSNILEIGACLGTIAVRTEMKGAVFLTQSSLAISRINLGIATLPAALEVCAGTQLVSAGVGTAKIVMDIGSCSASSVFSNFTRSSAAIA